MQLSSITFCHYGIGHSGSNPIIFTISGLVLYSAISLSNLSENDITYSWEAKTEVSEWTTISTSNVLILHGKLVGHFIRLSCSAKGLFYLFSVTLFYKVAVFLKRGVSNVFTDKFIAYQNF